MKINKKVNNFAKNDFNKKKQIQKKRVGKLRKKNLIQNEYYKTDANLDYFRGKGIIDFLSLKF